jgi:hypothetical protein
VAIDSAVFARETVKVEREPPPPPKATIAPTASVDRGRATFGVVGRF